MENKIDLSVRLGSLKFENPFILASAPPTADGDFIRSAFSMGWAGAVIKTMKPDDMEISDVTPRFGVLRDKEGSVIGFENFELVSKKSLSYWTKEISNIKSEFPKKILIASIMADINKESWQKLAVEVEKAGADALELNFSCPHGMPEKGIGAAIGQDPKITRMITEWVKEVVSIPVIVKLSPNVTDIQLIAEAAIEGGADALAAINTVQCLIGIDIETLNPMPSVDSFSTFGGYSGYSVKPIGLRCVAQIAQCTDVPIYGMGGISSWSDAVEYMAVGAGAVQVCTEVMLKGFSIIRPMLRELKKYMHRKNISSLEEIRGIALKKIISHESLSRDYVVKAVISKSGECTLCGKCITVCGEAGYSAIAKINEKVCISSEKCDGCSLCSYVCPHNIIKIKRVNRTVNNGKKEAS